MIHQVLSVAMIPAVIVFVCLVFPPLLVSRLILQVFGYFASEDMKGKVVLITGASSGIGEQMAYEYAKRGASLALVARRERDLRRVADRALKLGSPVVIPVSADVSNVDDCKRFVDETVKHFGQLDHLVNNAGVFCLLRFQDATDVQKFNTVMDVNFWGSVYPTSFAIPHLKKTKGKIIVNASASSNLNVPLLSFYAASKAAVVSFFESVRVELAPAKVRVTIITPGVVDSEMSRGKLLNKNGVLRVNHRIADAVKFLPLMSSETFAKAIVDAVCKGNRNVTEPKWYRAFFTVKMLWPELMEWFYENFENFLQFILFGEEDASKLDSNPTSED